MLNAPLKPQKQYDYGDTERVVYSWDEIFFELGRLTEKAKEELYVNKEPFIYKTASDGDMPKQPYITTC